MKYLRWTLFVFTTLAFCLHVPPAYAQMMITIAIPGCPDVTIKDNTGQPGGDVNDTNPKPNVISFDTSSIAGLANCGITGDGMVTLGPGGALTQLGAGAQIVDLTEFTVTKQRGGADTITLHYEYVFQAPAAPIMAEDGIKGSFYNHPAHQSFAGDTLTFQGKVNGNPIMPIKPGDGPGLPFVFTTVGSLDPENFAGGHGVQKIPAGGPPWTLSGDLTVKLKAEGDQLFLPNSAEVGIVAVPEPSSLLLASAFLPIAAFVWRRRKKVDS